MRKNPPYVASAIGATSNRKKTRATKAASKKQLLEFVDDVKQQVEPKLRKQGHKQPAAEAEKIAAEAYDYSLEAIRQARKRARKIRDT